MIRLCDDNDFDTIFSIINDFDRSLPRCHPCRPVARAVHASGRTSP